MVDRLCARRQRDGDRVYEKPREYMLRVEAEPGHPILIDRCLEDALEIDAMRLGPRRG